MKELLQKAASKTDEDKGRFVYIYIAGKEFEFAGNWQWELYSDAVFCSDVMLSLPSIFEGTFGLIHPEDKALVEEPILHPLGGLIPFLQFRIITTYGEIKIITGKNLLATEVGSSFETIKEAMEQVKEDKNTTLQLQKLTWQKRAGELAEKLQSIGTFYLNAATSEMYYSDEVYRIYNLPPQGLNAHMHSFLSFIHPDDKDLVVDVVNKAFKEQLPLQLDYRIIDINGSEKIVQHITHWEYNDKGTLMFYGSMQDITEQKCQEAKIEKAQNDLIFQQRLLQWNEQANIGHWYINLLTRKIVYSDAMYRMHGLKPNTFPAATHVFLNYVHPEDRGIVQEVTNKILKEHTPPDIEYRIVRSDRKVRYLRQRGKLVVYGDNELVMVVTVQDITSEVVTAKKLSDLNEQLTVRQFAHNLAEEVAGMGSWFWDLETGKINWSESIYPLLGLKEAQNELSQKLLLRTIHIEDQKTFSDELHLFLERRKESLFPFRIIRQGQERFLVASFKLMIYNGKELFIGSLQDITQTQQLKKQLTERAQLAESISENIQDAVFITDTNNSILFWNKRCEEMYGLKKEQVLRQNFFDVFPDLKKETVLKQFNELFKGQPFIQHSVKSLVVKGLFDLFMFPLRDDNGAVTGILHIQHDVTKEQNMQKRLTERLNFIESMVEASVDRIIVMDRHMNYMYCNQKAADFYKLAKEDIIGKNVLEIFPNAVSDPSYEQFRKALRGETIQIPAIEGLGDEHHYQVFLIPIKDDDNNVSAVLWMHHDLSGEIKLQRQLRKSDEILNALDVAIIELDEDFHFRFINPTGLLYLGRSEDQLIGKSLSVEFPDVVKTEGFAAMKKAAAEKVQVSTEYYTPVFKKWVYLSATPSPDGGVILLFNDRQNIKDTQNELQEEHRRLKEAQLLGNIGNFEWSLGTDHVLVSEQLSRIYGLKPHKQTILLERLLKMVHPEDTAKLTEMKKQVFSAPGIYQVMYRIINKNGEVRYLNQQLESLADESNKVVRVQSTVQDITDLKKREKELEEKNEELAAFAFIASHDLKEPLRKIQTFSDWLIKKEKERLSPEGKNFLDRMEKAVKRMDLLIEDVLTLSRLRTVEEPATESDINKIVAETLEELQPLIMQTGAIINKNDLPIISGYPSQLFYLFNNLIGNALKFQKKGVQPIINIEATIVKSCQVELLKTEPNKEFIAISITDNGIGFDSAQSKKIFQIFQRLHSMHEYPGTGIGLAICKKVMENHGGFIEAKSLLNKGSVFSCYFPK